MPEVILKDMVKVYGKNFVASSIDYLKVEDGEFFVLLGPSGCGKTTTLRVIAGLIKPTKGKVFLGNRDITDLPPEKRNITMVFQNFALFPHLNVFENIAYGLRMRNLPENEIKERVQSAARLMRIENLLDRRIDHLSGGQQQRVGVARAIAPHPDVILFDEPLSNLDAKLREEVRFELKEVHKRIGTTSIYVTHDQAEAMVMADRVAIMNQGKIVQIGTPKEIYLKPKNLFVAGFMGIMSALEVEVVDIVDKEVVVKTKGGTVIKTAGNVEKEKKAYLILRPETMEIAEKEGENTVKAKLKQSVYLGGEVEYRVLIEDTEVRMRLKPHEDKYKVGDTINVRIVRETSWVVNE